MKLKYYLNNTTIIVLVSLLILNIYIASADNSVYAISDNQIIKANEYKIVVSEDILSDILIDKTSIYFYTNKILYNANSSTGEINYKVLINNITQQELTDTYIILKTKDTIYTINKVDGSIISKNRYTNILDSVYTSIQNYLYGLTCTNCILDNPTFVNYTFPPGGNGSNITQDQLNLKVNKSGDTFSSNHTIFSTLGGGLITIFDNNYWEVNIGSAGISVDTSGFYSSVPITDNTKFGGGVQNTCFDNSGLLITCAESDPIAMANISENFAHWNSSGISCDSELNTKINYTDTIYTATTQGQIINISSSSELNSTLLNLSVAPSLLGNIILNITTSFGTNETWNIPKLIYNGYFLKIKGNLNLVESGLSATKTSPVFSTPGSYGTLTRSSGSWNANTRNSTIAYDGVYYYTILYNNATQLYHGNNVAPVGPKTISLYNWSQKITGNFIISDSATVIFEDIEIAGKSSGNNYLNGVLVINPYATVTINRVNIYNTAHEISNDAVIYLPALGTLNYLNSIISSDDYGIRANFASNIQSLYQGSIIKLDNPIYYKNMAIDIGISASGYMRDGILFSVPTNGYAAIYAINNIVGGNIIVIQTIISGFYHTGGAVGYGFYSGSGGNFLQAANGFLNNEVNFFIQNIQGGNVELGSSFGSTTIKSTTGTILEGLSGAGNAITQVDSTGKLFANRTAGAGIPYIRPDGTAVCITVSNLNIISANTGACT